MYMSDRATDMFNLKPGTKNKADKHYGGGNILNDDYTWSSNPDPDLIPRTNSGTGGGRNGIASAPQPSYNPYAEYMAYLEKQRAEQQAARDRAAETARKNQQGIFDTNANKLNQQANSAQQQAYINYMLSKRDLPQQLSAQGLSGGAAESTYANLYNSYGNSRNTTEQNRLNNLADLQQTLQNNLAQIEQQRLSGDQADIQNYYANLSNLAAQNIQSTASLRQGSGGSSGGTNYAKNLSNNYYSQYLDARGKGYNDTEASALAKEGIGQYVFSLLSSGLIDQAQADAMMKGFGF